MSEPFKYCVCLIRICFFLSFSFALILDFCRLPFVDIICPNPLNNVYVYYVFDFLFCFITPFFVFCRLLFVVIICRPFLYVVCFLPEKATGAKSQGKFSCTANVRCSQKLSSAINAPFFVWKQIHVSHSSVTWIKF